MGARKRPTYLAPRLARRDIRARLQRTQRCNG